MQRGTFQLMKSVNKSLILNKIRTNEPISRAEIAKITKLTPPTVSSIVKELIEQGIVRESEVSESSGGRRPTMLHINNDAFYVVGVDAGPNDIACILADLSGEIHYRTSKGIHPNPTSAEFLSILKESVHRVLKATSKEDNLLGIGVAMHGVVNVDTGESLIAPNLNLTNVPIKVELEREFNLEVKVENDARAMALGESWFGNHGKLESMITVNLGRGVGAGVVVNGRLYHGAQDLAGEIGHMTIDINGSICECGNRGCLQTFASGPAIAKRAIQKLKGTREETMDINGETVYRLAVDGNEMMIEVLRETAMYLGIGLTNLIHIINPELIVIGGGVSRANQFILPTLQDTIEKWALTPEAKQTKVVITQLGEDATLLGAVSLFLVEFFLQT